MASAARLLEETPRPTDPERCATLRDASRDIALALAQVPRPQARGPLFEALLTTAVAWLAHPAAALTSATPAPIDAPRSQNKSPGWALCLTRIFAGAAWRNEPPPPLADQPAWLWPTYARYLFAAPAFFQTTEEESRWAAHTLAHLDPLVRMLEFNRGSASAKTVARIASASADAWPCVGGADQQRLLRQGVARLRMLLAPRLAPFAPPLAPPEPGRPLRVGLLHESAAPTGDALDAARLQTLLDPERIELLAFAQNELAPDAAAQVDALRAAGLDAVIFAGDLTRADGALASLALHRVAPRQFATAHCPHTTGLPMIDVFLADALAVPAAHTEQLAELPAALAFDPPSESPPLSRADLGLPAENRLIFATVDPARFPAATRARWSHALDQDVSARLIALPGASGPTLDLLLADLVRQFGDRLILAGDAPLDSTALHALLGAGDAYLVSHTPADHAARALAHHLGLHVPDAPARLDCLAFADALTDILETACRAPGQALPAPLPALDAASRHVQGWDLLTADRPDRAALYLLAAVEDPQAAPEVWHDLALSLHANHQAPEAIQALETCVQLAPDRLDSWLLLADWASDYGHAELLQEIADIAQTLAPADPRVTALAARLAA